MKNKCKPVGRNDVENAPTSSFRKKGFRISKTAFCEKYLKYASAHFTFVPD